MKMVLKYFKTVILLYTIIGLNVSCGKNYLEPELIGQRSVQGDIIGFLIDKGDLVPEGHFPIVVDSDKLSICDSPKMNKSVFDIKLPGNVIDYFQKNKPSFDNNEFDNIYLSLLCRSSKLNQIVILEFPKNNILNGSLAGYKYYSFPVKAEKIVCISYDKIKNSTVIICQPKELDSILLFSIDGKKSSKISFRKPTLMKYYYSIFNTPILGYDGTDIFFYNNSNFTLKLVKSFNIGTKGDILKSNIEDTNNILWFTDNRSIGIYDGVCLNIFDSITCKIVDRIQLNNVQQNLFYELYVYNDGTYYVHNNYSSDEKTSFIANKLLFTRKMDLLLHSGAGLTRYFIVGFYYDNYYFISKLDFSNEHDNDYCQLTKYDFKPIPGKVEKVLYTYDSMYFYTKDSVWVFNYSKTNISYNLPVNEIFRIPYRRIN